MPRSVFSQAGNISASVDSLKNMSLEQLMDIEVTSVSKRPEKLSEVASAIQVITQEEIHRSGVTSLPEALRLSPNLQVAQLNSYAWIISARGFNNVFSNKLLVMIDGRTVYSPLFAGVFWDAQSVPLQDIERIEVISGPGGTLWGANAVNGVINIITKKAKDTKGLYLSALAGSFLNNSVTARYGGTISPALSYRVFVQHDDRDKTLMPNGQHNADDWKFNQAGMRMDWDPADADKLSLQANFEGGTEYNGSAPSTFDQQNVMGQWTHTFSEKSDLMLQAYYDRTWRRDLPSTINDQLETYDIDLQHHFLIGKRNNLLWGAGYRFTRDASHNTTTFVGFVPAERNLPLYSAFIQDEILIIPDHFKFTLGTKVLDNVYSGFELQPSARLAWTPNSNQTIWGAVSRAVRTPSRIDVDYHIPTYPVPPNSQNVGGGPNFTAEKLIAYELGYRVQPADKISFSFATFYNRYDDLYSVEVIPNTLTYLIQNGVKGHSEGAEINGIFQVLNRWELRGGYTFFHKILSNKPGHNFDPSYEGTDPQHQVVLQSMLDLFKHFQFDVTGRYISGRPLSAVAGVPAVAAYANFDVRLAYQFKKFEFSVAGQNLANPNHVEFAFYRIPRNIYTKVTMRL